MLFHLLGWWSGSGDFRGMPIDRGPKNPLDRSRFRAFQGYAGAFMKIGTKFWRWLLAQYWIQVFRKRPSIPEQRKHVILIPRDIRTIIGATQTRKDDHVILIPRGIRTINVRPRPLRIRIFVYETEKNTAKQFRNIKTRTETKNQKNRNFSSVQPGSVRFCTP